MPCRRTGEEGDGVGDVLVGGHGPERDLGDDVVVERRVLLLQRLPHAAREPHRSGRHGVDPDAGGGERVTEGAGVLDDRRLEGPIGVGRRRGSCLHRVGGADGHHRGRVGGGEERLRRFDQMDERHQVELEARLPLLPAPPD